jgi:hypothetical protein
VEGLSNQELGEKNSSGHEVQIRGYLGETDEKRRPYINRKRLGLGGRR